MAVVSIYGRCTCGNLLHAIAVARNDAADLNLVLEPCFVCMENERQKGVDSVQTAEPEEASEPSAADEAADPRAVEDRIHRSIVSMGESITKRMSCLSNRVDQLAMSVENEEDDPDDHGPEPDHPG